MIAALMIFGLIAAIALLIPVSFEIIVFAHNYRIFQKRDDDFFDYATIDYSTLKRLYQINPNGYELSSFGQLYRINHSHGLAIREVRIVFKTIFDYFHFEIDKKHNKKTSQIAKRRKQEEQGLSNFVIWLKRILIVCAQNSMRSLNKKKRKLRRSRRVCGDRSVISSPLFVLMVI